MLNWVSEYCYLFLFLLLNTTSFSPFLQPSVKLRIFLDTFLLQPTYDTLCEWLVLEGGEPQVSDLDAAGGTSDEDVVALSQINQ